MSDSGDTEGWRAWRRRAEYLHCANRFYREMTLDSFVHYRFIASESGPRDLADFILRGFRSSVHIWDTRKLAEYMTKQDNVDVLKSFTSRLEMRQLTLVGALRVLFAHLALLDDPTRDNMLLVAFSEAFVQQNPSEMRDTATVLHLCLVVLCLNKALHHESEMTAVSDFVQKYARVAPKKQLIQVYEDVFIAGLTLGGSVTGGPSPYSSYIATAGPPRPNRDSTRARSWPAQVKRALPARVDSNLLVTSVLRCATHQNFYDARPRGCVLAYVDDAYVLKLISPSLDVDAIVDVMKRAWSALKGLVPFVRLHGRALGCAYILMDRMPGRDLMMLKDEYPEMNYRKVDEQIAGVVADLGSANISHNDLHAGNILVDDHLNITAVVDWDEAGPVQESTPYRSRALRFGHDIGEDRSWDSAFRSLESESVLMHGYRFDNTDFRLRRRRLLREERLCER